MTEKQLRYSLGFTIIAGVMIINIYAYCKISKINDKDNENTIRIVKLETKIEDFLIEKK